MQYVRDVPLANFSNALRSLEDRHRVATVVQDLQCQTSTLDLRSTAHTALLERISADPEKDGRATVVGSCVLNVSDWRCKLHCVQRVSSALFHEESTICGVTFGFWASASHPSTSFPLDSLCGRCFGEPPTTLARSPSLSTAPLSLCSASLPSFRSQRVLRQRGLEGSRRLTLAFVLSGSEETATEVRLDGLDGSPPDVSVRLLTQQDARECAYSSEVCANSQASSSRY